MQIEIDFSTRLESLEKIHSSTPALSRTSEDEIGPLRQPSRAHFKRRRTTNRTDETESRSRVQQTRKGIAKSVDAAGKTRIVSADELLYLEPNIVCASALPHEKLGERAHVAFEIGDVLRRRSHDGGANDVAPVIEFELMEERSTWSLGEADATTRANGMRNRSARPLEVIGCKPATYPRATIERVDELDGLGDVVRERVGGRKPAFAAA